MPVLIIAILFIVTAVFLIVYQINSIKKETGKAHLPADILEGDTGPQPQGDFGAAGKSWEPLSNKFKAYAQRLPWGNLRKRITRAGSPLGILEFFAFKALCVISAPALAFIFLGNIFANKIMLLVISLAAGYFLPEVWLNNRIKKRQHNIRKDLPNIIDLLNLCVSGGMDFMLAVNRVSRDFRVCDLTNELSEVYRQTQMGKARKEALKNFALHIDIPEVHSFVRTLIQADRMGTPMSEALKMQSEEIRVRRFQRGETMALKAPIKLLIPLFLFILPVVLILVAGPILLEFTRSGIGF